MKPKPVIPRRKALQDVENAVDYYRRETGEHIALEFIQALEDGFRHIAQFPESGSPRYGHELGIQNLRYWPLKKYPHLIFFRNEHDHVDVWRLLHAERDIAAWMRGGSF
jgi:toxin ParE1/3/4